MQLLVTGAMGNIGRRVMAAFPGSVGIDMRPGAQILADLGSLDYHDEIVQGALEAADALVHLGTSANPEAPDRVHWQAVGNCARLLEACHAAGLERVVLASSDWAEPREPGSKPNTYGHSKRVFEAMAAMYDNTPGFEAVALRIGWIPADPQAREGAPAWLAENYWDDARLITELRGALGLDQGSSPSQRG